MNEQYLYGETLAEAKPAMEVWKTMIVATLHEAVGRYLKLGGQILAGWGDIIGETGAGDSCDEATSR